MHRFSKLFWSHRELSPGEQQRAVEREFPMAVADSHLRLWHPADPLSGQGVRVLVGVATWSGYDMCLLDVIDEGLGRGPALTVEVFNTADCHTQGDLKNYVPGINAVYQTPVVGIWQDGRLEWVGQGAEARERVARMFGSTSADIVGHLGEQPRPRRWAPDW